MNQHNSIKALINLVDDPDESIFGQVRSEIIKYGIEAIPYLSSSWNDDLFGNIHQNRIKNLIDDIHFSDVKTQLKEWMKCPEKDLLKGAIIVSRYISSEINSDKIYNYFEELKRDIWLEMNNYQTAFEKIKIINRVLFEHHNFSGDKDNYHSPGNSYIHQVIKSKKGNPLSLSLIYSVLAQSLDVPVYGVNLPKHFILAYMDMEGTNAAINKENDFGTLFYINPFSNGKILNLEEIKSFLDDLNLKHDRHFFEPCSNSDIIKRMVNNLIYSYKENNKKQQVSELNELLHILKNPSLG